MANYELFSKTEQEEEKGENTNVLSRKHCSYLNNCKYLGHSLTI